LKTEREGRGTVQATSSLDRVEKQALSSGGEEQKPHLGGGPKRLERKVSVGRETSSAKRKKKGDFACRSATKGRNERAVKPGPGS